MRGSNNWGRGRQRHEGKGNRGDQGGPGPNWQYGPPQGPHGRYTPQFERTDSKGGKGGQQQKGNQGRDTRPHRVPDDRNSASSDKRGDNKPGAADAAPDTSLKENYGSSNVKRDAYHWFPFQEVGLGGAMGFIESPGNSVPEAIKRNVGGMPDTLSGCFELSPDKSKRNGEILRVVVQGNTPPHAPVWGLQLDMMPVETEPTVVLDTPSLSPFKERLTEMTALAAEILGLKVRDLPSLRRAASGSRVYHHLRHLLRDSWINEKMYAVWLNGGNFCEIESVPTKHTWILQKIDDFFHLWLDLFQTHISLEQMIQTNWYKEHAEDTDKETYALFTFQMMARKIGEFSEICEMRTDRSTGKFSLQQKGITRCVEQLNTRLADTVRPEADEATQKLHAEADKLTRGVKKTAMELAIDPVGLNSQLATEKKANGWGKAKEAKGDAARKTKWGIPQEEKGDAAKKPSDFSVPMH